MHGVWRCKLAPIKACILSIHMGSVHSIAPALNRSNAISMRQVNLHDVASEAGVSAQTVSRVINNRPDVAPATRERVWNAINRLGYKPNALARGLVAKRSRSLGIITMALEQLFHSDVIAGFEQEARRRNYVCQMAFTDGEADDVRQVIGQMLERQVEGVALLVPIQVTLPPIFLRVPMIALAHPLNNKHVINIDIDNVTGGYTAVNHLLQLGHTRIGQIAGPGNWKATHDRMEGARRALAEAQLVLQQDDFVMADDWTLHAGYEAAKALLARNRGHTAYFCHNDSLALGAMRALRQAGYTLPDEFSIVGYDDLPTSEYTSPTLTSIRQPMRSLGQLMAELLITAAERDEVVRHEVIIPVELVVRESTTVCKRQTMPKAISQRLQHRQ